LRRVLFLGVVLVGELAGVAGAAGPAQIATDPFVNVDSQHATLVEPDSFAFGSTIVAAVQAGRYLDGGASDIEWATSTNGGSSWTSSSLPGTTTYSTPPGPYSRLSDPSVAYDQQDDKWLISSLALGPEPNLVGVGVIVNASTDGGQTWGNPVAAATNSAPNADFDKDWITCDNTPTSPYYGNCYVEYDDYGNNNQVHVAYSTDGGAHWAQGALPNVQVLGGEPVVQPNGTVVMPIDDAEEAKVLAFRSTDGGAHWIRSALVATIRPFFDPGDIRGGPLPSAQVDGSGRVWVVWADCRFRTNCGANDIVFSSSTNGKSWSHPKRIPIDDKKSAVDTLLPGLAVDPSTSGKTAHLGVVYYYFPDSNCLSCQLDVGFVSSTDAGKHWSAPVQLAGPMQMTWLPDTSQGRMVGDYMAASFVNGQPMPVFVKANAPTAGTDCSDPGAVCDVSLYAASPGLAPRGATRPAVAEPSVSTGAPPSGRRLTAR
jgi:hypothetical protein